MAESLDDRPGTSQTSPTPASGNTVRDTKVEKCAEYNVTLQDGESDCVISGLSITPNGRRLLADYTNSKIKMFSRNMEIINSLSLPLSPWGIAVTGDREAVVGAWSELFILDVSDKQMSIRRTVKLDFAVWGIAAYKDKLVVTSPDHPLSVKLIDHNGNVYWSTSTDQQGQWLFYQPDYVACYDDRRSSTVIVSDSGNETLTLLDINTGSVISRHRVEGKMPNGVTTDPSGYIYVSYRMTDEVTVWTRDLSEEKILLTLPFSNYRPSIVYDTVADKLVVIHYIENE